MPRVIHRKCWCLNVIKMLNHFAVSLEYRGVLRLRMCILSDTSASNSVYIQANISAINTPEDALTKGNVYDVGPNIPHSSCLVPASSAFNRAVTVLNARQSSHAFSIVCSWISRCYYSLLWTVISHIRNVSKTIVRNEADSQTENVIMIRERLEPLQLMCWSTTQVNC